MKSLWTNRVTLAGLYTMAMGRAFLRYRDPRRRASGRHLDAFYRQMWREAAETIGASFKPLGPNFSEISRDGVTTRVTENVSGIDDPVTLGIMHDKVLTHQILRDAGLTMPRYAQFSLKDMSPAIHLIQSHNRDCVVKPAGGTGGGRGVTTGIRRLADLARAAAAAACYSDDLLIEEQIPGDNYRLLYLDGELIDSFVRQPPTVMADGRRSVGQLLRDANAQRLQSGSRISQVLIAIDMDMQRTLAKQGLSMRSVPPQGRKIVLKTVINENGSADNTTATSMLCNSIIKDGQRAVQALGARFVGMDLITTDPSVPLAESGGAFIEANGTPNLYYHYQKADAVFPVAVHLLRRLLIEHAETSNHFAPVI